jgi:uncharacterized damage-inducible protein DinB
MNPQSIRDLFEYSYWAFDLIWPSIDQLDDDQFVMDLDYSFGSIRNQIIHLVSSHRRWQNRLQLIQPVPHLNFDDFPTISITKEVWDAAKGEMLDYVNSLDQAALDEVVPYKIPGRSIDTAHRRWEILLHLVNHSTDHRSQMLAMLNTHFDSDTPEQDYIIYLWEKRKKG